VRSQPIIETAVYVNDLQAAETFYGAIRGLRVMSEGAKELRRVGVRPEDYKG
jgi:catechol 2,3-dioxygenase-like lactoylglutathione lyase family enzyme